MLVAWHKFGVLVDARGQPSSPSGSRRHLRHASHCTRSALVQPARLRPAHCLLMSCEVGHEGQAAVAVRRLDRYISAPLDAAPLLRARAQCEAFPRPSEEGRRLVESGRATPRLLRRGDLRGALHNHTTESDGLHSLEDMRRAATEAGLCCGGKGPPLRADLEVIEEGVALTLQSHRQPHEVLPVRPRDRWAGGGRAGTRGAADTAWPRSRLERGKAGLPSFLEKREAVFSDSAQEMPPFYPWWK